jgi:hypothetical protein
MNSIKLKKTKVTFEDDLLKYKPTRGANKIIQGHIPSLDGATTARTTAGIIDDESPGLVMGNEWMLPCKLLDNRQGIMNSLPIWHRNDYARDFPTADEGY